ncbi:glycosyl transferase [Aureimonas sp. SA4125]|uniref:glycosyltransferase n=1 Tax=Aureimonas sp. SA4125 TaxID=2826993 RepID=UPI001CC58D8B|nr:glycosyltransferase [Aureimonas sp. SA4125]BDA82964.1 glycosyl transferase [Aureimonas sp. SA4125]
MIMHVITNFSANAGAEAMLSRLIREPSNALVVPLIDVSDRYRESCGPSVRFMPLHAGSVARMMGAVPRLARIIKAEKPEAIVCWMYHAMVVGALAHRMSGGEAPLFWNVRQSLDDPRTLTRSVRLTLRLCRALSRYPGGIVFNSARAAELHRRFGFRNARMTVIPNGFDFVDADLPSARTPRVFGIAARLHPQKDHRTFFRAAALLSRRHAHARFVAAGAGLEDCEGAAARLVAESGVPAEAVSLCGEVADMESFYRSIDVLVLSSLTEGFPNVVAEAMSYGVPVVTTDVGDAAAIVGDTGMVVPAGDDQALAAAMERMLRLSPAEYRERSAAARRRVVEHYSLPRVAGQYEALVGAI